MTDTPLRIALISEHASPLADLGGIDAGGQNVYVAEVARALARAGHRVDVLTRRDDAALPAQVAWRDGVQVLHLTAGPAAPVRKEALLPHMQAFAQEAERRVADRGGYDVVHANFFMSGWVGLQLQRRCGIPLVTTFHALGLVRREHQGPDDGFPAERVAIEARLVRQSHRVIAECPQDVDDLGRLYGADPRRLAMVPCGVDLQQFRPMDRLEARRRLGWPRDAFIVLQLGRLVPRKGVDNVIRAVARMPADLPVDLRVVGGATSEPDERATPEIARLRRAAEACGAQRRVHFVGARHGEALRDCYAAADVFVTTPWYEPFGITPLEAMACGTPVIGARVGGIQHSVVDGVTGALVPPHDPIALADELERLARHPLRRRALGAAGRRRVRSHYTWSAVAEQLLAVYHSVSRGRQRWTPARHLRLVAAAPALPAVGSAGGPL